MRAIFRKSRLNSIVCVLLALVIATTHWGAGNIAASASDEMTFDIGVSEKAVTATLASDGVLTISGVGEIKDYTEETAPFGAVRERILEVKIGVGITAIGDFLFYNCSNLGGEIELPEKITRIGDKAFSGADAQAAPKPEFVINKFTEATVARDKNAGGEDTGSEESTTSSQGGEEASQVTENPTPVPDTTSSAPENSETESSAVESGDSDPAPDSSESSVTESEASSEAPEAAAAAPEPEVQPMALLSTEAESKQAESTSSESSEVSEAAPEATEPPNESTESSSSSANSETSGEESSSSESSEDENQYEIENITEQEIGEQIFFPDAGNSTRFFSCSAANNTFRAALKAAGYSEAESIITVSFDCGEGFSSSDTVISRKMAVLGGIITLPEQPAQFTSPADTELFDYSFGGWTESKDAANVVRAEKSSFVVGGRTDLYFIANWNRRVLVNILKEYGDGFVRLSVPELSGYEVVSCRWQTCVLAEGELLPANEDAVSWQDIPNAAETSYEHQYTEDENRLFRCVLEVKEQSEVALLDLLGIGESSETVTLAAVNASPTYEDISLKALKNSNAGTSAVSQSFYLPVSQAGSVYAVTAISVEGEFTLVAPTTDTDGAWALPELTEEQIGSTFALSVQTADSQELGSWASTGGGHVVGNAESVEFTSSGYPVSAITGKAEMSVTLLYNGAYETFSGGTVELTFNEYGSEAEIGGETSYNTVVATVTLGGGSMNYEQIAAIRAGRHFSHQANTSQNGAAASVAQNGSVTASFTTWYYPDSLTEGSETTLYLYDELGVAASFPAGTDITLMTSSHLGNSYYFYTASGEQSVPLSEFVGYTAPADSEQVTENLTFVLDFSGSSISAGSYSLVLQHSADEGMEKAQASFNVITSGTASLNISKSSATDASVELTIEAAAPSTDTRYLSGATVTLYLSDSAGARMKFPSKLKISGVSDILTEANYGLCLDLALGTHTLTLDFADVTETMLASGEYSITAELRPKTGLQTEVSPTAQASSDSVSFTLQRATEAERAISVTLADPSQRLADVSLEEAKINVKVSANIESGDTVRLSIYKKTGTTPDDSSYERFADGDAWCSATSGIESEVTVTIPQGTESGTYRALFEVANSSGETVAKEPLNFIVK